MSKATAFAMLAAMIMLSAAAVLTRRMQINRIATPVVELSGELLFVPHALQSPLAIAAADFGVAFVYLDAGQGQVSSDGRLPLSQLDLPADVNRLIFSFL